MILLLTTLLGCKHYTSVDDACLDTVPGEDQIDDEYSIDFDHRATCWRRLQGLSAATLNDNVQIGVTYHTAWIAAHADEYFTDWPTEDDLEEGYYGYDVWERLDAGGFDLNLGNYGLWEFLWIHTDGVETGDQTVDVLMQHSDWHEIVEQFEWRAAGFGQAQTDYGTWFTYGVIVYDFPSTEARTYAVWPPNGMVDVPVDGLEGRLGTPLSIVVGASTSDGGYDGDNPYDLEWVEPMTLTGPAGAVPVSWSLPGELPGAVPRYSIAGYAQPHLTPGAKYDLDGTVKWITGQKKIHSVFTTAGAASASAARTSAGGDLRVRWVPPRTTP